MNRVLFYDGIVRATFPAGVVDEVKLRHRHFRAVVAFDLLLLLFFGFFIIFFVFFFGVLLLPLVR